MQLGSKFINCTALGNAHDGIVFHSYIAGGEAANYCTADRCTVTYNMMRLNNGQAISVPANNCTIQNCLIHDNVGAGIDFLDYNSNTDSHDNKALYNTVYNNGGNIGGQLYNDSQIYCDGAHDILILGNVVHQASNGPYAGNLITATTENSGKNTYNINIVNNLLYDTNGYNIHIAQGAGTAVYGCSVINNTCVRDSGGYGGALLLEGLGTSVKTIVKNNIFLRTAGSYPLLMWSGAITSSTCDMDYNIFYDPNKTTVISDSDSGGFTLAQWVTNRGLDTHSIQADPKLINTIPATMDAHLDPTSPAINQGATAWTGTPAIYGTTLASGVIDSPVNDSGYHYISTQSDYIQATSADSNKQQIMTCTSIVLGYGEQVTAVELHVKGTSSGVEVKGSLLKGSTWLPDYTSSGLGSGITDNSFMYVGSWTQAELDGMQIRLTAPASGLGTLTVYYVYIKVYTDATKCKDYSGSSCHFLPNLK